MKRSLFLILLCISISGVYGQQVYVEMGSALSRFDYRNSKGEKLDNLHGGNHFLIKAGYHSVTPVYRLNFSAGMSYSGYVSRGSDDITGNFYDWDANYLGIDLGADYEVIKKKFTSASMSELSVYLKATVSPEILVHGTQVINEQVYNLVGVEQFKYPFFFARGGAGISYSVSRMIGIYGEILAGYGFPVKIGDKEDLEKLRIINANIGFGVIVNLPSYKSWK